jgi:hypothetical protein
VETLLGVLILVAVAAIAFALLALPFALVWLVVRGPRPPRASGSSFGAGAAGWTDDDEYIARHHH